MKVQQNRKGEIVKSTKAIRGSLLLFSVISIPLMFLLSKLEIENLILSTIPVLVSATFLLSSLLIQKDSNYSQLLLNGNFWLGLSFVTIFVMTPLVLAFSTLDREKVFGKYDWTSQLWEAQTLAASCLFATTIGNLLVIDRASSLEKSRRSFYRYSLVIWPSVLFILFFILLYLTAVTRSGNIISAIFGTRLAKNQTQLYEFTGYGVDALIPIMGILTLWLVHFRLNGNEQRAFVTTMGICVLLIPSLTSGNRSIFIFLFVVILLVYISTGSELQIRSFIVFALLAPILFFAPTSYRTKYTFEGFSFLDVYSAEQIRSFFTIGDTTMLPALSILISRLGTDFGYFGGKSYLNIFLKPIPRDIWPKKPIEFDTQIMNLIFPEFSRFVGFSFSAISEPLVNFGKVGAIFFFAILGYLNRRIVNFAKSHKLVGILSCSWISAFMFVLGRGNLSTDIHRVAYPLGVALFVLYVSKRRI